MKPFEVFPFEFRCTCAKGWTCAEPGQSWPEKCGRCLGAMKFSGGRLARVIGVDRRALYRVRDGLGVKPETAAKMVQKLVAHFPEAFL